MFIESPFMFNSYYDKKEGASLKSFKAMSFKKNKNALARYHMTMSFNKTNQMFDYNGLPKTIPKRVLELQLQMTGYTAIFEHKSELYSTFCGLGGRLDYNYMPTIATIANPYLGVSGQFEIGKNCVVIPNDSLYMGLTPLINYYATQLTENDLSMNSNLIISRLMHIIKAKDEDVKLSLDEVIKDLEDGAISSALDEYNGGLGDTSDGISSVPFSNTSNQSLIQLIEHKQYIKGSFWNELGVQSNYNMKRETITSNENILNVDSLLPLSDNMMEMRKIGLEKIKELFGITISVDFSSSWKKIRDEIKNKEDIEEDKSNRLDNGDKEDGKEDNNE